MPKIAPLPKRLPVVEKLLSRGGPYKGNAVWGRCYHNPYPAVTDGVIHVDPRLKPLDYLDTLLHELIHREFPDVREEKVVEAASLMARELWEKNFRKIQI